MTKQQHNLRDFGNPQFVGSIAAPTHLLCHRDKRYHVKIDERVQLLKRVLSQHDVEYCLGTSSRPLPTAQQPWSSSYRNGGESSDYCWVWFRSDAALNKLIQTLGASAIAQCVDWFKVKSSNLVVWPQMTTQSPLARTTDSLRRVTVKVTTEVTAC